MLTAHVTSSVGWVGAVLVFLALAVVGLTSQEEQSVRAVYIAAELITWYVIVPLALASLLTGVVQALGTTWGLFRHYWSTFKFLITVFATLVLLLYTQTVRYMAGVAADPTADLEVLRSPTFALHGGGGLILLLVAVALGVYKPRGMTPYGRRKQREEQRGLAP